MFSLSSVENTNVTAENAGSFGSIERILSFVLSAVVKANFRRVRVVTPGVSPEHFVRFGRVI